MSIERYFRPIVDAYASLVEQIAVATGVEDQLLHVHTGLLILVLARLFTRRSFASPVPLAIVAAAELINEIFDRLHHGRWMPDTTSDVVNTLFWPLVIFAVERWRSGGRSRRR